MIKSRRDVNPSETEGKTCGNCRKLREKRIQDPRNPSMVYTTYVCGVDGFDYGPLSGLNRLLCDKWIPAPNYYPGMHSAASKMEEVATNILNENQPADPVIEDVNDEPSTPMKDPEE